MRSMFGYRQEPGLGKIEDLTGTVASGHARRQGRTTVLTGLGEMIDGGLWICDLAQGLALVPLLPARLAARFLAKAPGPVPLVLPSRRLVQSVTGRRLAAVRAVQTKAALKLGKPGLLGQQQINQLVFRQKGKGFTIH